MPAARRTYCNPLSLPPAKVGQASAGHGGWHKAHRSLADPSILKFQDSWYLFASGSQAWVSDDLLDWKYVDVEIPAEVIGPSLVECQGYFYLSGNNTIGMYRSRHPLGPWEHQGPIHDHRGEVVHWADLMFFVDDDGRFYTYHHSGSGVGSDGIFVTEMDPAFNFTRALAPTLNCFAYVPSHAWERWGSRNEFSAIAWIEAPWMTKLQGRYYLQYSGAGTEWRTYAVGLYSSESPLGPFVYDERSPLLKEQGGLLNGCGHHALVEGPGGTLWNFYHVLFHNSNKWDRRLAMDPVGLNAQGQMILCGPSETPQWAPGNEARPELGNDAGQLALSIDKPVKASSAAAGLTPECAVDNFIRSHWQSEDAAFPQWLEVDLLGEFEVRACRVILAEPGRQFTGAPTITCSFKVETSADGKTYEACWQQAGEDRDIFYWEGSARRARHVRLTIEAMPAGLKAAVQELTVFGTDSEA